MTKTNTVIPRKNRKLKSKSIELNIEYLTNIEDKLKACNYPVSKWILFSKCLLKSGYFQLYLYCPKSTTSKYIYVKYIDEVLKVRFSNHAPRLRSVIRKDSDIYVNPKCKNKRIPSYTYLEALTLVKQWYISKKDNTLDNFTE